jgi:hypothetical protein
LICRHFNISYRDLVEWLPWDEYYIMSAVALDLDELEQRWEYILAGGEAKKWKWTSPDKAGTIKLQDGGSRGISGEEAMDAIVGGLYKGKLTKDQLPKGGDIKSFAEISEQQVIKRYEYPDGKVEYRDGEGNLIDMPEGSLGFVSVE